MSISFNAHGVSGTYHTTQGFTDFGGIRSDQIFYNISLESASEFDIKMLVKENGEWNHSEFPESQLGLVHAIAIAIDEVESL